MKPTRRRFLQSVTATAAVRTQAASVAFQSDWPEGVERTFCGPEYWANRLQDWRISHGRLECVEARPLYPLRTVHLLTHRAGAATGGFEVSVSAGPAVSGNLPGDAAAGFLIGAGGGTMHYRAAALIHHAPGPGGGLFAGCHPDGQVFFRDFETPWEHAGKPGETGEVRLRLSAEPDGANCRVTIAATDSSGRELSQASTTVPHARLSGNVALVSHPGTGANTARYWFRDWRVSGTRIEAHPGDAFGPILCTQYTCQNGILKLTAQLMPVGSSDNRTAELQVRQGSGWKTIGSANVVAPGFTAPFRVEKWDTRRDTPFRVLYRLRTRGSQDSEFTWEGTVRRDPAAKDTIVLASLSCVQQIQGSIGQAPVYRWNDRVWFPHADMVPNLARHDADLYFFAGDQIYEGNPTRPVRAPLAEAELDYLYKWYLWCWTYGEAIRHRPCICIPDDHDVYHGNIWGMGGRASRDGDPAGLFGGYGMPPEWINMIQRTQTSHLPDPFDPTPAEQGISVYYTSLTVGGIGFAILEDRKFKSSPAIVDAEKTRDSHIVEKNYDPKKADVPGATLLGERQLRFLREYARDWRGHVMKAALSQTIFCNLQISSRPPTTGLLDHDLDSNGWPQSGRNAALRELRRAFMIHIAGDQHLPSTLRHGVDEFDDAVWSLCSPAAANLYIRYWNPDYPPLNHKPGMEPFTGHYLDGFGNRVTVRAVANPVANPKPGEFPEPMELHRKAPGYNIVRFRKSDRTITMEAWPRYVNPQDPKTGSQYPGWPITIRQEDNYARKPAAWLPAIEVDGARDPLVEVIGSTGELIYALRIRGRTFDPKVFAAGVYTVRVSDPESGKSQVLEKITATPEPKSSRLTVNLV